MTTAREQGEGTRLSKVLSDERSELESMFDRIEAAETGPDERRRLVGDLLDRLSRRAALREELLYPRVSSSVPDGDSLVDLAQTGRAQIERTGQEITALAGTDPTFGFLAGKLLFEIGEHLDEEETDVVPALVDAIGSREADALGERIRHASPLVS